MAAEQAHEPFMFKERDLSGPARTRQRVSGSARRADTRPAGPVVAWSAASPDATLAAARVACQALLTVYRDLRRADTAGPGGSSVSPAATAPDDHAAPYRRRTVAAEATHRPCLLDCYLDQPFTGQLATTNHRTQQPTNLHALREALLGALMLTGEHPDPAAAGPTTLASVPPYVRRAVDAIHAHPARPYTVVSLAELSGVKVRTLQQGFRTRLGISPMAYLRSVRLSRAHDDLLGDQPPGVAEVAYRWGFTHLGRFAAAYAAQYGEAPSRTRDRQPQ